MSDENNENNENIKEESKSVESEVKSKRGGVPIWVWFVVLILVGVCLYFLSLINSKRFMLSEKNGYLVIKKGLFLPFGYAEYIPQDVVKRETYSPIKIPDGERITPQEIENGELDVVLFRIISNWIEKFLQNENEENIKQASMYIERLMRLNVSPDDFEKYSRLKGELVFRQARFSFDMGLDMIRQAQKRLENIEAINPEFRRGAEQLITKIQNIEKSLNPEYTLIKNEDILKIREEVKKECINSCVKATLEHPTENPPPEAVKAETSGGPPQPEESQ